jgi:hypothetical protein
MYTSVTIAISPLKSGTKPEHDQPIRERCMKRVSRSKRAAADIEQEARDPLCVLSESRGSGTSPLHSLAHCAVNALHVAAFWHISAIDISI